jgi:hypothetical protein
MIMSSVDTQGAKGDLDAISQQGIQSQVQNAQKQEQNKEFTDALETAKQLFR